VTPDEEGRDLAEEQERREQFLTHWEASAAPASGAWGEKRRLTTAMRRVIERLVLSDAPEDELRRAADRLEQYADHLATHPRLQRYEGFAETSPAGDVGAFFDRSPLIGLANPLAPPIAIRPTGEKTAEGIVRFGSAYEGPPGCVHGGFVAAAFDEVLGFVQSLSGQPGFTGTLTVIYRKPTPLHTELRFATSIERTEGRKVFTRGEVYAGELLTAEAEAIFISADREKYQKLIEERERREAEREG
jgi:acyl-coenzyme A thioesterase PaaI-like protein